MFNLLIANPLFLWLLPLAGLPVLFHLFLRVRRRVRPVASLMFFRAADPHYNARRRLREWLALLLRVLALAALLAALARPVWTGAGAGGPVAMALLVDNSASLADQGADGRPKLSEALEAAAALIADLGRGDRAVLGLTVEDPAAGLRDELTEDRAALLAAVGRIRPTEAAGLPALALARCARLLRNAGRAEVHIFTDLQEHEWGRAAAAGLDLPATVSVQVHAIATPARKTGNACLAAVVAPERRLLAGRPAAVRVTVQNTSTQRATVRLHSADAASPPETRELSLPAGERRDVAVTLRPGAAGLRWLHVWMDGDAFEADNQAWLGCPCEERARALLFGPREAFGALPAALSPDREGLLSGLAVEVAAPAELAALASTNRRPLLAVAAWEALAERPDTAPLRAALLEFVKAGGALLVAPAVTSQASPDRVPAWLGAAPDAPAAATNGAEVVVADRADPLWDELRDERGEVLLRNVRATRFAPLRRGAGAVPLLLLADGRVLFTRSRVGQGVVFASGLAFHRDWSNLSLKPAFLPLVQGVALACPPPRSAVLSLAAGVKPLAPAPAAAASAVVVRSLEGNALEWRGAARDLPAFARTGVYSLEAGGVTRYAAVRASEQEGEERMLEPGPVPLLQALPHRTTPLASSAALVRRVRSARTGVDFFLPALLLSGLAVVLEGLVVNPRPRRYVRPASPDSRAPANRA